MLSVPHLDREFDYLVSAEQSDDAQPGVRVRVRFHGRLVDGFLLERRNDTDHTGKLGWLDRVVSPEPVLTPESRRLVDAVAARYAGTRPDVLRLAVPARHARVEREPIAIPARPEIAPVDPGGWEVYGRGGQFLTALAESRAARAVWQALTGRAVGRPVRRGRRPNRAGRTFGAGSRARPAGSGRTVAGRDGAHRRAQCGGALGGPGASGALPALAGRVAGQCPAGDRYPQCSVRAAERPGAGHGVGRCRRHAGRATGAVSACPGGGDAARTSGAVRGADRRLCTDRGSPCAGAQRLGARHRRGTAGGAGSHSAGGCPGRHADTPTNATRRPAPREFRPSHCAPLVRRWTPGRRCWCRCRGAGMCRRWPAGVVARLRVAGIAPVRCRCRIVVHRAARAVGVAGWSRR